MGPRAVQALHHLVEGGGQDADLPSGPPGHLHRGGPLGHAPGGRDHRVEGPADAADDDPVEHAGDEAHGHHGEEERFPGGVGQARLGGLQGEGYVQHAQHALLLGRRVTTRTLAADLVRDHPDGPEHPMALIVDEDPRPAVGVQGRLGNRSGVAADARLLLAVHRGADLVGLGGEGDLSFLVEDPDAFDAGLTTHGFHGLADGVAPVDPHVVVDGEIDRLGQTLGAEDRLFQGVLALRADQQVGKRGDAHQREESGGQCDACGERPERHDSPS